MVYSERINVTVELISTAASNLLEYLLFLSRHLLLYHSYLIFLKQQYFHFR